MPTDKIADITDELFHQCALFAYFCALSEDRKDDSEYVRRLTYELYEEELRKKNANK